MEFQSIKFNFEGHLRKKIKDYAEYLRTLGYWDLLDEFEVVCSDVPEAELPAKDRILTLCYDTYKQSLENDFKKNGWIDDLY